MSSTRFTSPMKHAISEQLRRDAETPTTLADEHQMVRRLCDELESIADALPSLPGQQRLATVITALRVGVSAHCRHEEVMMRLWQAEATTPDTAMTIAIERIASEHCDNESLAYELAESLETVITDDLVHNPEALGLQIRLYFMVLRRHLMWEDYLLQHIFGRAD